jgi:anion-transporting  ArsA/GET3 family ATPase
MDSAGLEQRVPIDSARGELWAALLDVGTSLDRAVNRYAEPKEAKEIIEHPVYKLLRNSLAGMQELMAIERIHQALTDGFDAVFIDTAPSRHALEFLDKPEFFTHLVSFPIVKLVGRTYKWWVHSPFARVSNMSFELFTRVEEILGATLVHQVLDFFSIFRKMADGYSDRAEKTLHLLRDPEITSFTIVSTPFKAKRDGEYFCSELSQRKFPLEGMVVNRLWPVLDTELPADSPPKLQEVVHWYDDVCHSHQKAWAELGQLFAGKIPRLRRIPELSEDMDGLQALYEMVKQMKQ